MTQSVAAVAGRQFGVVSIDQLLALGLTYREIGRLVAQGFLHRLFRGVFAVGHRNIGQWGWLKAASLAGHPAAAEERDRCRLLTKGIQTLRFTDFRIEYDLAGCLDDIRAVMKLRRLAA